MAGHGVAHLSLGRSSACRERGSQPPRRMSGAKAPLPPCCAGAAAAAPGGMAACPGGSAKIFRRAHSICTASHTSDSASFTSILSLPKLEQYIGPHHNCETGANAKNCAKST